MLVHSGPLFRQGSCEEAMGHGPKELRSWPAGLAIVIVINVHTSQQQRHILSWALYRGHQRIEFALAFPKKKPVGPNFRGSENWAIVRIEREMGVLG